MSKKKIILHVIVLSVFLSACGNNSALEKENTIEAIISGSFVATIRDVLPDFVLDDTTLQCAVVTEFQSSPYIIYIGEETSDLIVGETYVFTLQEKNIGEVDENLIGTILGYKKAQVLYGVTIESFRLAEDEEIGLNYDHVIEIGQ